jgi:PKD repeat protein
MKKLLTLFSIFIAAGVLLFQSCKEETSDPPKASIFYSIANKQVAFTSLTKRVVSWEWNFGDGKTSTEKDPVHIYEGGGYYSVTLNCVGEDGSNTVSEVTIAVSLTPYVLLTGGATAVNGKTWKLTTQHSPNDKFANADADLSLVDGVPSPLPPSVFSLFLGMGEVYDDTYTFYFDGGYSHDTKDDHAAFAGLLNQMLTDGGVSIVNAGGQDFGLCTASYTPQTGATFTYVEKEDFSVPSVYGPDGILTYTNVSTLDFSGTEFVGFLDYQRKVIVQEISDNSMRLVMFMAASPDYFPANTNALVLSFEVVPNP